MVALKDSDLFLRLISSTVHPSLLNFEHLNSCNCIVGMLSDHQKAGVQ